MASRQINKTTKTKRKRSLNNVLLQDVSQFANLTGLDATTSASTSDLHDDCMIEMNLMMEMGGGGSQSLSQSTTTQQKPIQDGNADGKKKRNQQKHGDDHTSSSSLSSLSPSGTKFPAWMVEKRPGFMTKDDIQLWHQDFKRWADTGLYTPGLLPNIDQELARNFKVKELSSMLLKNGKDLRMPVFERWLIDSKFEEAASGRINQSMASVDPVLPSKASPYSNASKSLVSELISSSNYEDGDGATMTLEEAQQKVAELCRSCNVASQELMSQIERYSKQSSLRKGDRIEVESKTQERCYDQDERPNSEGTSKPRTVTILYARKKWKKPFCFRINASSLERLRQRFFRVHNGAYNTVSTSSSTTTATSPFNPKHKDLAERSFLVLVVSLLLRYSALSGGQLLDDLRGGGMQGAIHSATFDVLQKHLSSSSSSSLSTYWLEGFASPFNATLDRFGSAFPDIDWHFGSVGSFWGCSFAAAASPSNEVRSIVDGEKRVLPIVEEFCEANPPFSPGLMEGMVTHIMQRLQVAERNESRLTFVVIVPTVKEQTRSNQKKMKHEKNDVEASSSVVQKAASPSFRTMVDSMYCTKHIRLRAREHGYIEGAQHLRPTQYKQSSYDTSVIFLRSPAAAASSSSNDKVHEDALEKDIRTAFASHHESELKQRKGK